MAGSPRPFLAGRPRPESAAFPDDVHAFAFAQGGAQQGDDFRRARHLVGEESKRGDIDVIVLVVAALFLEGIDQQFELVLATWPMTVPVSLSRSVIMPTLLGLQAAAACDLRGPFSKAWRTCSTTRSTSSLVMAKCGVKRSELVPPWITPMPCSRMNSSVEFVP